MASNEIPIRIRTEKGDGYGVMGINVHVEDAETGRPIGGVYKAEINMDIDSIVTATLHMYPSEIDVEALATKVVNLEKENAKEDKESNTK